ncbi:unnamed protein product [Cylindrotheca closterium]|uniref:Uncharacterized protein n=1 Tax=Cylindrotheca closterium TaxID=2856 RepID=A0AAD2CY01_9STRA|nr:unnamed protein product [Cylindrotheca closterium]
MKSKARDIEEGIRGAIAGWSTKYDGCSSKKGKEVFGDPGSHFKQLPDPVDYKKIGAPTKDGDSFCTRTCGCLGTFLWTILGSFNQIIGLIVIFFAVLITTFCSLLNPYPKRSKKFSIFCCFETIIDRVVMAIWKIIGIPWMMILFCEHNGDGWVELLEICTKHNYFVLTWWLENEWIPKLGYRSDIAVFIFARVGRANKVSKLSGVDGPDEETQARREVSMSMVEEFRREKRDVDALEYLKSCHEEGADLNWPDPYGTTVLSVAIRRCYVQCVNWLLEHDDADPNRQDHYYGNTGMHLLVYRTYTLGDGKAAAMVRLLLDTNRSDFTILNYQGSTPYMMLDDPSNFTECANALKPRPSFDQLKKLLKKKKKSARQKCDDIYKLISKSHNGDRSLHHLHVIDMLFCANEGSHKELESRRKTIFDDFLKQVLLLSTQEVSDDDKLTHDDVALLRWMYYQSAGPPGTTKEEARGAYIEEFNKLLEDAQKSIEKRYGEVYKSLESEKEADEFFDIGRELYYTAPKQKLRHSTFLPLPDFIRNQNGIQAVRDLKAVGAIQNSGDFCDLLQGRHRLFGDQPLIGLFLGDPRNSAPYWRSLLLIWQICLQEIIKEEFEEKMSAIADNVEGVSFKSAPGVKGFLRSYEKTEEYGQEFSEGVDASMRVIDGLRCSFIVDSLSQNLQVGKLIESTFGVARTKNLHQRGNVRYADRKYNVVFVSDRKVDGVRGPIQVICEVQVLLKKYDAIKADGHLLYEFQREPEQKAPLNLRSIDRNVAKLCNCFGMCCEHFLDNCLDCQI